MSLVHAFDKGRSHKYEMLVLVRRWCANNLAAGILAVPRWLASELNPADEPSRRYVGRWRGLRGAYAQPPKCRRSDDDGAECAAAPAAGSEAKPFEDCERAPALHRGAPAITTSSKTTAARVGSRDGQAVQEAASRKALRGSRGWPAAAAEHGADGARDAPPADDARVPVGRGPDLQGLRDPAEGLQPLRPTPPPPARHLTTTSTWPSCTS